MGTNKRAVQNSGTICRCNKHDSRLLGFHLFDRNFPVDDLGILFSLYTGVSVFNVNILDFDLSVGEKSATIGLVVPIVLDIHSHLKMWKENARFCKPLVVALDGSLRRRFKGIFINCDMEIASDDRAPYHEKVYLIAAVLDPQYKLHWVDADVVVNEDDDKLQDSLKLRLKGWPIL